MFKHLLSSIGFGGQWVNTTIEKSRFALDESIIGSVMLSSMTLPINQIELQLIQRTDNNDETSEFSTIDNTVQRIVLTAIKSDTLSFAFQPPFAIANPSHQFFITTRVFLDNAVDLYDEDEIFFER